VEIKMYIKKDFGFEELKDNSWSGAVDTLEDIEKSDKEEELMELLEQVFFDEIPTDTEVNDYLWFERDEIYSNLGLNANGELEEEEEEG
jgi:hypothetical protein